MAAAVASASSSSSLLGGGGGGSSTNSGGDVSMEAVRSWSTADVAAWLQSVRLEVHAPTFEANHITGSVILDVDKTALKQMGIAAVGDRVRLDKAIRDLKRAVDGSSSVASSSSSSSLAGSGFLHPHYHSGPLASTAQATTHQRTIAPSQSADQLGIHSRPGSSQSSAPARQASSGLPLNHHYQQQAFAYSQQRQAQPTLPQAHSQYSSALPSPYSHHASVGGPSPNAYVQHALHPPPQQTAAVRAHHASAGVLPLGSAADVGPPSRPGTSGSSGLGAGPQIPAALAGPPSSASSLNAFSNRRSAHPRPPPLQLAHSANYALQGSSGLHRAASNLAPGSRPAAEGFSYRPRSSSGANASTLDDGRTGNPLTHSLYLNAPTPNASQGQSSASMLPQPLSGYQQTSTQATPTGLPLTNIIGSGWTAHPGQRSGSVSGPSGSIMASHPPPVMQRPSTASNPRLPSPTYPPNANANLYSSHRKQLSSGHLSTAPSSSSSRSRTAAGEYTSSMQTNVPGMRNHNASSYVRKPHGSSSSGRSEKGSGLYSHQTGAYASYGGYYPPSASASISGHTHQLSTSSNSSASAGSGHPGFTSTASSPTAAIFTPPTARPGGIYGGSDESGLEGGNSPFSRTPTTPSKPYAAAQAMDTGSIASAAAAPIQIIGQPSSHMRPLYQPVGLGGSSLTGGTMYSLEDVKRRTIRFHCEELGTTCTIPVSDCRDAHDVLARVLQKFQIRGGASANAYPPYHGQGRNGSDSEDDDEGDGDKWAIFASSPDGKTKWLSDNELIAICHAPQPHDPLRERGLHLRRIAGGNTSRVQQTRRNNKLKKLFGESEIPEAGSAAAGANTAQGSPGLGRSLGKENHHDAESYEGLGSLSSNASRKPKMNRASTITFMSGLGIGGGNAGRSTANAEREQMLLQQQQHMALQQFRDQHAQGVQLSGYPSATAGMYSVSSAPIQAALLREADAPLQAPPLPVPSPAATRADAATSSKAASAAPIPAPGFVPASKSGSSVLNGWPRLAKLYRPPSEMISSNLQDFFPAAEKKVLEQTARRSIYGKASMRSKRDSTWSFKPPGGLSGMHDDEGEPLLFRRSAESYEQDQRPQTNDDTDSLAPRRSVSRDAAGVEASAQPRIERSSSESSARSEASSGPARSVQSGPPTLPPVVGRFSLDDWSASLHTAASPVPGQGADIGDDADADVLDNVPETPTAIPQLSMGTPVSRDDDIRHLAAPASKSRSHLTSSSTNPSGPSSPLPSTSSQTFASPMHLSKPRSIRRNSGESSRSRRSFARSLAHAAAERDRDRSDVASLLTVDEIAHDIENREMYGAAVGMGGGGVIDADGNPVPTRKSLTGRWTGDADSISILSKRPTILLTDDDHSSIAARSLRSLKRNRSTASRKRPSPGVSGVHASGSGRNSMAEDRRDGASLHTPDEGLRAGSPAAASTSPASEAIEEDDEEDEDDADEYEDAFDEEDDGEDVMDDEDLLDGAGGVSHPAHRAGKARRKWLKGALIGAGSFGSVYLGMDQRTGLYMAVKQVELPTGESDNEQRKMSMLEALEREIALLKTLEHPNIVQYLDSYADDSHLNIFLEYVPGGSVVGIMREFGSFQEPLVQLYITQTLLGLQFLHGRGIVHSDIKGANILIDTKGQLKISDFGISKKDTGELIASSGSAPPKKTALSGSVFWMAPEAIKQTSYSRKADIWSVGCLVVEMLTGVHPWPNLDQMQAIFRIGSMKAIPPLPDDISDNCRDFLACTFELEHTKRPTAAELLAHAFLTEIAELEPDEPVTAPEEGNSSKAGRSSLMPSTSPNILATGGSNTVGSSAGRRNKGGKRKQPTSSAATAATASPVTAAVP